jgi:hypothetical protein
MNYSKDNPIRVHSINIVTREPCEELKIGIDASRSIETINSKITILVPSSLGGIFRYHLDIIDFSAMKS